MKTFQLLFERYVPIRALARIKATDIDAAMKAASDMDTDALEWAAFADHATPVRLGSISDGRNANLARVQIPAYPWTCSWTHVDLREQWPRALDREFENQTVLALHYVVSSYCERLTPTLSEKIARNLADDRLERDTPKVSKKLKRTRL